MLSNITFKHRLIGAIFLVSLAIIIVPALFDTPRVDSLSNAQSPEAPLQAAWEELDKIEYTFSELPAAEELNTAPVETVAANESVAVEPFAEEQQLLAAAAPQTMHSTISAPNPEPNPEPQPQPAPEPAPKAVDTIVISATEKIINEHTWAVQLGAFSKIENAKALAKRLEEKGYDAVLEEMAHIHLTRVLVGTADKQQATQLLSELDKNMQLKGIVVKFNPQG